MIIPPTRYSFDETGVPEKDETGIYVAYEAYEYLFNEYQKAVNKLIEMQKRYCP